MVLNTISINFLNFIIDIALLYNKKGRRQWQSTFLNSNVQPKNKEEKRQTTIIMFDLYRKILANYFGSLGLFLKNSQSFNLVLRNFFSQFGSFFFLLQNMSLWSFYHNTTTSFFFFLFFFFFPKKRSDKHINICKIKWLMWNYLATLRMT